ncbi:hypothetical protein DFJ77DRAFT_516752 [Powellomyces hirtus]|nr:hypothetical protein DFJ77DRAFT_516752 [Powellomyces hirtus]
MPLAVLMLVKQEQQKRDGLWPHDDSSEASHSIEEEWERLADSDIEEHRSGDEGDSEDQISSHGAGSTTPRRSPAHWNIVSLHKRATEAVTYSAGLQLHSLKQQQQLAYTCLTGSAPTKEAVNSIQAAILEIRAAESLIAAHPTAQRIAKSPRTVRLGSWNLSVSRPTSTQSSPDSAYDDCEALTKAASHYSAALHYLDRHPAQSTYVQELETAAALGYAYILRRLRKYRRARTLCRSLLVPDKGGMTSSDMDLARLYIAISNALDVIASPQDDDSETGTEQYLKRSADVSSRFASAINIAHLVGRCTRARQQHHLAGNGTIPCAGNGVAAVHATIHDLASALISLRPHLCPTRDALLYWARNILGHSASGVDSPATDSSALALNSHPSSALDLGFGM